MKIFTKRNALVGWLAVRVARRRLRRRVGGLVGRSPEHRGLALGAGAAGAALGAALFTRRARHGHAGPA